MTSNKEVVLRIVLSAIIGGLIGMEREFSKRPAGLRTHMLVSIGSALIMLVSINGFIDPNTGLPIGDPSRLAAQVVSGIGFLGAGTIIRTKGDIKGLTTAASLWICAGIGLSIGNGYYLGSIITAIIVMLALLNLGRLERKIIRNNYKNLEITAFDKPGLIGQLGTILGKYNILIKDIKIMDKKSEIDYSQDENFNIFQAHFLVEAPKKLNTDDFIYEIIHIENILKLTFDDKSISIDNRKEEK